MFTPPKNQPQPKELKVGQTKFPRGVITVLADSIMPVDGLADLTNAELVQDARPRPRPSLAPYGDDLIGDAYIGMGTFVKIVDGLPEYHEISMQTVGGVGKVYTRKDGGTWNLIGGSYDDTAWVQFCQSNFRVYISNGVDNMSYYDIELDSIVTASALSTPSAPTPTKTGLTGTNYTYYYKITANNAFGETAASTAGTVQVGSLRDVWDSSSNYVTVTWSSVSGATSYNIYVGDSSGNEYYLATVTGLSFKDDGSVAVNIFRLFPSGNSTTGPTLTFLYNSNGQLFGVGDINNPSYLWYSGQGSHAGDFSPFNGGGYVAINYGGETIPTHVRPFRTGKGDPAITVLSRGAGNGKLHHVTFDSTTVGDTVIVFPNVFEANGQDGTVSKFGVVEANNSLYYPTGDAFKSTGTKPSVINILNTDDISEQIQPSVQALNRAAMDSSVGLFNQGKIYWAVPTGSSSENNEIWILDLSRKGLWILRWTVAAKFMWLYQDNSGVTHHLVLTYDNQVLEFTRAIATTDNGVGFRVRVASGAIVFDDEGVTMASVEMYRFKLLYPKGSIQINIYGLGEEGALSLLATDTYTQTVSRSGWGQLLWSDSALPSMYSDDVGAVDLFSQSVVVVPIEVDETLNEIRWEVIAEGADIDFILASERIKGTLIPGLYYGD